jgi:hypothetical protein
LRQTEATTRQAKLEATLARRFSCDGETGVRVQWFRNGRNTPLEIAFDLQGDGLFLAPHTAYALVAPGSQELTPDLTCVFGEDTLLIEGHSPHGVSRLYREDGELVWSDSQLWGHRPDPDVEARLRDPRIVTVLKRLGLHDAGNLPGMSEDECRAALADSAGDQTDHWFILVEWGIIRPTPDSGVCLTETGRHFLELLESQTPEAPPPAEAA